MSASLSTLLSRLVVRDVRSVARGELDFLRETRLHAWYLQKAATVAHWSRTSELQKAVDALERVEIQLRDVANAPIRDMPFDIFREWRLRNEKVIRRSVHQYRKLHLYARTATDHLGMSQASIPLLHKSLKRSVLESQLLLDSYAHDVRHVARFFGLRVEETPAIDALAAHGHLDQLQVESQKTAEYGLQALIALPNWMAFRHHHLPLLAHEVGLMWLRELARPGRCERFQRFLEEVAEPVASILQSSGLHKDGTCPAYAQAYVIKMLADMMAYAIAGPAYMYSLYFRVTGVLPQIRVEPEYLSPAVRLGVLLDLHENEFPEGVPSWGRAHRELGDAIRQRRAEYDAYLKDAEDGPARLDYEKKLTDACVERLSHPFRTREEARLWRSNGKGGSVIADNVWDALRTTNDAIPDVARPLGREELHDAEACLRETGWRVPAVSNVLWSTYWSSHRHDTDKEAGQRNPALGQISHVLLGAGLRPYGTLPPLTVNEWLEIRFHRVAPGSDVKRLRERFNALVNDDGESQFAKQGLFLADVLGESSLLSMRRTPLASEGRFPPVLDDQKIYYGCDRHLCGRLNASFPLDPQLRTEPGSDHGQMQWYARLTRPGVILMISQFLLQEKTSTAEFVARLQAIAAELADHQIFVEAVCDSLGPEDVMVLWSARDQNVLQHLGEYLLRRDGTGLRVRHSRTQFLINGEFTATGEHRSSGPPAPIQGTAVVTLAGVRNFSDFPRGSIMEKLPGATMTWVMGKDDLLLEADISDSDGLLRLRNVVREALAHENALEVSIAWKIITDRITGETSSRDTGAL